MLALFTLPPVSAFVRNLKVYALVAGVIFLNSSCSHIKPVQYMTPYLDEHSVALKNLPYSEATIEPGEFLEIVFVGKSPEVTALLNNYGYAKVENVTGAETPTTRKGIEVDKHGVIELPLIGKLNVTGMTRSELKDKLTKEAGRFLQDPIVYMGPPKYKITVLGEVKAPQIIETGANAYTILDALARSGDMSNYAIASNVKVYRSEGNKRAIGTVNVADSSLFLSPYFYLKNNDVVYVPAQNEKMKLIRRQESLPIISVTATIISLLLSITSVLLINNK